VTRRGGVAAGRAARVRQDRSLLAGVHGCGVVAPAVRQHRRPARGGYVHAGAEGEHVHDDDDAAAGADGLQAALVPLEADVE